MGDWIRRIAPVREDHRALAFIAVWAASVVVVWAAASSAIPRVPEPDDAVSAYLLIDGVTWQIRYESRTENATVFRLLQEASETVGFPVEYVEYGWPYEDVFITSINGTRNDQSANLWWQFCVNGAYGATGAAHQELGNWDRVKWAYAPPGGDGLCG